MGKKRVELEQVTIELPKGVMDFLKSHVPNPLEYLSQRLISVFRADLEDAEAFSDYDEAVRMFNLKPVFDC